MIIHRDPRPKLTTTDTKSAKGCYDLQLYSCARGVCESRATQFK